MTGLYVHKDNTDRLALNRGLSSRGLRDFVQIRAQFHEIRFHALTSDYAYVTNAISGPKLQGVPKKTKTIEMTYC